MNNMISGFGKSTDNAFNLDVDNLQVNESEEILGNSNFYDTAHFYAPVILDDTLDVNGPVEANNFTARDSASQFVVQNASQFDLKVSTSTSPVFKFLDANNSLATSTIEANIINASQINNTQTISANTSNDVVFSSQKNSGTSIGSSAAYIAKNSDNDGTGIYMQSTAGGKRGQVRSSTTAFGLDLQTDGYGSGANKSIKLYTDHTTVNSDLSVINSTNLYGDVTLNSGKALKFNALTLGTVTLNVAETTNNYSFTLPTSSGTNGQYLTSSGGGVLSWTSFPVSPTFTSLKITSTEPALNSITGALQVAGGISVNRKSYIAPSYSVPGEGFITGITAGLVIDRPSFSSQNNIQLEFSATVHIKGPPDYLANIQPFGEATAFALVVEDVTQLDILATTGAIGCAGELGVVGSTTLLGGASITGATYVYGPFSQSLGATTLAGPSLEGIFTSTMELKSGSNFSFESTSATLSSKVKSANKLNLEGTTEVNIKSTKFTTTISGETEFTTGSILYKTTSGNFEMESFGAAGFTSKNVMSLSSETSSVNIDANNDIKLEAEVGIQLKSKSAMNIRSDFTMEVLAIDDLSITAGDPTHQNSNISINTTLGAINLNTSGGSVSTGTTGGDIELDSRNAGLTGGGKITLDANILECQSISNTSIKTTNPTATLDLATNGGIMKLYTQGGNLKLDTRTTALTSGGALEIFCGQFSANILSALLLESVNSTLTLKTNNKLLKLESNGGPMTFDSTLLNDKGAMSMTSGNFGVTATGTINLESTGQQFFKTTGLNEPMTFTTSGSNMIFSNNGGMFQLNLTTSPTTGGKFDVNCDTCEIQTNNGFKSTVSVGNYDALVTTGDMDITVSSGKLDITTNVGALGVTAAAGALNLTATAGTATLKGAIVSIQALVGTATMSGLASVSMTSVGTATMTGAISATVTSAGAASVTGAVTATLSSVGVATVNGGATLALTGGGATTMTSVGLMTITGGAGLSMTVPTGAMLLSVPLGAATITVGAGLLAISAAIGGMTFTTGVGLMQFTGAAGGIAMNTAAGDITIAAGILPLIPVPFIGNLNLFAGLSNVNIKSSAGAINIIAKAGGVNVGCTSETDTTSQIGHFAVKCINGFSAAETGNISLLTFDDGLFDGPGNIELSTFSAQVGNITLQAKGNLKIVTQNSNPVYLNTSAVSSGSGYDFKFPADLGTSGQVLTTNGDGNVLTWTNKLSGSSYFELTSGTYDMNNTSPLYTNVTVSTGGSVQIKLPDATTVTVGSQYVFNCNGSTPINVKTFTNSAVVNLQPGSVATLLLTSTATSTGVWDWHEQLPTDTKWSATALTTPTTITTENTTDASALNTGSLITLGGAAISKKLFVGDSISIGLGITANSSILLQNVSSGTVNNALSIGTPGSPTVFKFFPFFGILEGPIFRLLASTSGQINLQCPATTSPYSLTFPSSAGSVNQVLTTNGSGVTSWTTPTPQTSAFTTPVTITIASATSIVTPALQVSLTTASTDNFYATFLNAAAPNSSNHTICLGHDILDCAYLRYTYVSAASTANYYSIGNSAAFEAFKFYPATSRFTLSGSIESTLPSSSTTSTTMLSLLQPSAVNNGVQSIALGVANSTNNQGIIQFNYASSGNGNNAIGFGSPGNLNKMKFFTGLGVLETSTFRLLGSTSGYINLQCPAITTSYSLTFPSTPGSSGQVLTTDGNGVTSWTSGGGGGSSAFTTPVSITIASTTETAPALKIALTGSSTTNIYATFLSNAAPNNSTHSLILGPTLPDSAVLQYNYVSLSAINNYVSIGNTANQTAFRFYPSISQFDSGSIFIGGKNTTNPVLMVNNTATASSSLASFLQGNAANGTRQNLVVGVDASPFNSGEIAFVYNSLSNIGNYLSLGCLNADNSLQIKGDLSYALGTWYSKKINYFNWDQGVPNGSAAIVISPSLQAGEASIAFRTDLNNVGGLWKIGQNVGGAGDNTFGVYSLTYNSYVAKFDAFGQFWAKTNVITPKVFSESDLELQAGYSNTSKINIHCGGYNTGGVYINSGISSGDHPSYGSTNIGNRNLGNCLFVGANRENYSTNANGVLNVSVTNSNNQVCAWYGTSNGTANYQAGNIELYYNPTTQQWVTGYNTASDYRLKYNIQPMTNGIATIMQLKPSYFNFAAEATGLAAGFIAHELKEVISDAVFGEKDAVHEDGSPKYQSISQTHIIPFLVGSVQELYTTLQQQTLLIADLTARLLLLEQK